MKTPSDRSPRRAKLNPLLATLLALATLAGASPARATEVDPWQPMNRGIFRFNDALDRWFLEPVATGYDFVVPDRAQGWVDNFFDNLRFPIVFANCLLQGKVADAGASFGRFMVNSTVGLAGFGDPATKLGVPDPNEDFGQTLGRWGIKPGPYLVLPFLGPSNFRDTIGGGVDAASRVWPWFVPMEVSAGVGALDLVNTRSLYLDTVKDLRAESVDFYAAVRDAYLQRRASLVEDRLGKTEETEHAADEDDLYFPDDPEQ